MERDFSMAMDGYIAACVEEEKVIQRYFLLPDMENHNMYLQSTAMRRTMLRILLERHADYIIHIVEQYRGSIGTEIDEINKKITELHVLFSNAQRIHDHDETSQE